MMLIHRYLHRYDAVMMECCMISPVCSTAVLATNMDTGDRRVLQHSNTAYCEHGTPHSGDGTFKLSIQCHLQFVYVQWVSALSVSTHNTQKPANKKLRSPAQRGDLVTKIDYETHYLHGTVQLSISWSIGSITVLCVIDTVDIDTACCSARHRAGRPQRKSCVQCRVCTGCSVLVCTGCLVLVCTKLCTRFM